MNYVDTEACDNQAEELKATVSAITAAAAEAAGQCQTILEYDTAYIKYNGLWDNDTHKTGVDTVTKESYSICQKFDLSDGNISSKVYKLQSKASELCRVMETLSSNSDLLKQVTAAIASNINGINVALTTAYSRSMKNTASNYIPKEKFCILAAGALGTAGVQKANLAKSAEDIKNRNFLNYSEVKDDPIFQEALQFRAQPDGTYRIYTLSGKPTDYYTTFTAANNYQRTLKRELIKNDKKYLKDVFNNNTSAIESETAKVATGASALAGATALGGASTTGNSNNNKTNSDSINNSSTTDNSALIDTKEDGNTTTWIYDSNKHPYKVTTITENKETHEREIRYDSKASKDGIFYKKRNQITGKTEEKYAVSRQNNGLMEKIEYKNGIYTAKYDAEWNKEGITMITGNKSTGKRDVYFYDGSHTHYLQDGSYTHYLQDGSHTHYWQEDGKEYYEKFNANGVRSGCGFHKLP